VDKDGTDLKSLQINLNSTICVQICSSGDQQFPRGILKSPVTESLVSSKQVQFFGLSSDSEISLVRIPKQWTLRTGLPETCPNLRLNKERFVNVIPGMHLELDHINFKPALLIIYLCKASKLRTCGL
jgi:hypothetical protein